MGARFSGANGSTASTEQFIEALDLASTLPVEDNEIRLRLDAAIAQLHQYNGASEAKEKAIRAAIGSAADTDLQQAALDAVGPSVRQIVSWYDLSVDLTAKLPRLLHDFDMEHAPLKAPSRMSLRAYSHASTRQAMTTHATRLLNTVMAFAIEFDVVKVSVPAVQNDLSFVRRSAAKNVDVVEALVPKAKMQATQLFMAEASPFVVALTSKLSIESARQLGDLSATALVVANDARLPADRLKPALRVLTAAFIMLDRASTSRSLPAGAFSPKSPVNAKRVVQAIRKGGGDETARLLSTLRFTSLNYTKSTAAVQSLVEDY